MSGLDEFRAIYFQECAELLDALEQELAAIADQRASPDSVNALFRAAHSIKGGAGAFGFSDLVAFTHAFENLLDAWRQDRLAVGPSLIQLCLRASDALAGLVQAAQTGAPAPARAAELIAAMQERLAGPSDCADGVCALPLDLAAPAAPTPTGWRIDFAPHRRLFLRANEPLLLLRELAELGPIDVACDLSALPSPADFDPEHCYLRWRIELTANCTRDNVLAVFDFVEGDCDLAITPLEAPVPPDPMPIDAPAFSFDDLLASVRAEAAAPLAAPDQPPAPNAPDLAPPPEPSSPRSANTPPAQEPPKPSIRVDLDRLDRLADLASEVAIAQAAVTQYLDEDIRRAAPDLVRGLDALTQHVRALQDAVMAVRALPLKSVFQRFPRLVREVAAATGKAVRLDIHGGEVEIDKTVIEQLADPLTHMIRNAIDHGIERPDARRAAGKPAEGVVTLAAEQIGARVLIHLRDDGAGVNRAKVRAKAIERGLITEDAVLSDEDVDALIFAPGFSTADQISNLSGRGVGMDVVRANIVKLGGRVSLRSTPGAGCAVTLSLPLTLAVMDGMQIETAGERFVLPLAAIVESLDRHAVRVEALPGGRASVRFRGEFAPVIDLAACLGLTRAGPRRFIILCEIEAGKVIGLIVDDVIGQAQAAVKSLEQNYAAVPGVSGATILGDGRVALILDPTALVDLAARPLPLARGHAA